MTPDNSLLQSLSEAGEGSRRFLTFGFISSKPKGGQHTNGPDYGTITVAHELAGVRIEIQTRSRFSSHKARDLGITLVELALLELEASDALPLPPQSTEEARS